MSIVVSAIFVVVGLLNFVPVIGAISSSRLEGLYGIRVSDPNLLVLLRHRAILFGLLGSFLVLAGFCPSLQYLAGAAGLVSMLSFVLLAPLSAPLLVEIRKVSRVDIVASALLAVALILKRLS